MAANDRKRGAEDRDEELAPAHKKGRVSQISYLNALHEMHPCTVPGVIDRIFEWESFDEGGDGDMVFRGCTMQMDIRNAAGEALISRGDRATRIEWGASCSRISIVPERDASVSIICTLSVSVAADGVLDNPTED